MRIRYRNGKQPAIKFPAGIFVRTLLLKKKIKTYSLNYYLDTNAIYQLKYIDNDILANSFYSSLNLVELVGGMTMENFEKRRTLVSRLLESPARYDPVFPDQLMFEAFDCFSDYEFLELRDTDLAKLVKCALSSRDWDEFNYQEQKKSLEFPLRYFVEMDQQMSTKFYEASKRGNEEIRSLLPSPGNQQSIEFEGRSYDLKDRRSIVRFLKEGAINRSFTICALAERARTNSTGFGIRVEERQVYESYNGLLEHFLTAMDEYSVDLITHDKNPRRNDFQDLLHVLYLRNRQELKIISQDKLFQNCLPHQTFLLKQPGQ